MEKAEFNPIFLEHYLYMFFNYIFCYIDSYLHDCIIGFHNFFPCLIDFMVKVYESNDSITIDASCIHGPCIVLPWLMFQEERERRSSLIEGDNSTCPIFLCRYAYIFASTPVISLIIFLKSPFISSYFLFSFLFLGENSI